MLFFQGTYIFREVNMSVIVSRLSIVLLLLALLCVVLLLLALLSVVLLLLALLSVVLVGVALLCVVLFGVALLCVVLVLIAALVYAVCMEIGYATTDDVVPMLLFVLVIIMLSAIAMASLRFSLYKLVSISTNLKILS